MNIFPETSLAPAALDQWTQRYTQNVMNTFGVPRLVLTRGEGAYVWDSEGRRYLDFLAGVAVNSLGHAHPDIVAAVTDQIRTLGHVSNFFASPPQIALAERLLQITAAPLGSRVFFCNSGAEANEAALKIARKLRPDGRIIAFEGAFHGRTMGALSVTAKPQYREQFGDLLPGVEFVAPTRAAVQAAFAPDVCRDRGRIAAVILEPIQGEAGVRLHSADFLRFVRAETQAHGALLILDEVQTGVGRVGAWLAGPAIAPGLQADVVTLAKGLAGGVPIGATIAFGEAASVLGPGDHGTTFGGNPLATAAGVATLGVIERDGLLGSVAQLGSQLREQLVGLGHPMIREVRGLGLLVGVELTAPVADRVASAALAAGLIVNPVNPSTIRLAPPLIISSDQLAELVHFLSTVSLDSLP